MINFRNLLKKTLKYSAIFVLALVVFWLGGEAGYRLKYYTEIWKNNRLNEEFNKSLIEMFQNDTYGGKTPEETFNLFVDALKNDDVELAVKYVVLDIERRQRYYDEFNEMKQQGKLKEYIDAWPKWEDWEQVKDKDNDWESRATIEYGQILKEPIKIYDDALGKEVLIQPGTYRSSVIFVKSSNNIWKIETL